MRLAKTFGPPLMRQLSRLNGRAWWARAMTLGTRAIVIDARGVLLVRHTYVQGWYLPGGGVDRGETAEAAVRRELREEAGVHALERLRLFGLYRNGRRDHVACYVVQAFEAAPDHTVDGWEIAETGFFPLDALPEGTTPATQARLKEWQGESPIAQDW